LESSKQFNISTGHLNTLGIIHKSRFIAMANSFQ
jgi:hypothetical protein